MEKDLYPFVAWYNEAMLSIIKKALTTVASNGLTGEHSFYVVFKTDKPTDIPEHLRIKYPSEMTIVLEHDFWDLRVDDTVFAVTLAFGGVHERLRVPWKNVVGFFDPSINYAIQLRDTVEEEDVIMPEKEEKPRKTKKTNDSAEIVNLSDFRKPNH